MASLFARGSKLYAKLKALDGTWKQVATGCAVGDERAAMAWLADLERQVEEQRALLPASGRSPVTTRR